jgi:hypothetical protein
MCPKTEVKKMNFLRQILFAAFMIIGFSLTATAQQPREEKKKPPKENAEIKPEENKKPKNNENNNRDNRDNRGKKPQTFFLLSENRIEISAI